MEMGFLGWLQISFIVLKLMGYIAWSWWWVMSPVLITFLLIFVVVIFAPALLANRINRGRK